MKYEINLSIEKVTWNLPTVLIHLSAYCLLSLAPLVYFLLLFPLHSNHLLTELSDGIHISLHSSPECRVVQSTLLTGRGAFVVLHWRWVRNLKWKNLLKNEDFAMNLLSYEMFDVWKSMRFIFYLSNMEMLLIKNSFVDRLSIFMTNEYRKPKLHKLNSFYCTRKQYKWWNAMVKSKKGRNIVRKDQSVK